MLYKYILVVIAFFLPSSVIAQNTKSVESQIFITHSQSVLIDAANSVSCNNHGLTYENSYYRNFNLYGDFLINGEWIVQNIVFGAALAKSSSGQQPVIIKLYTMSEASPLVLDSMTLIHSQEDVYFDANSEQLVNYPVTGIVSVPKRHNLVVEILIPDGQAAENYFFIASNNLGQSDPSYVRAPSCNVLKPVTFASMGYPDKHIVLEVYGQYAHPHAELLAFEIEGQITDTKILNEPDYSVELTMPYDTDLSVLAPEISVPAGFYSIPASGDTVDFSSGAVEYVVTNQTGKVSQSWLVNVEHSSADILSLWVDGQIGETLINAAPDYSVYLTMPADTSLEAIAPNIEIFADFIVSPSSGTAQDFSEGPVSYQVRHRRVDYFADWLVYVEQPTMVNALSDSYFSVSPNPADKFLYIRFNDKADENKLLSLYSLQGSLLFSAVLKPGSFENRRIELPDLPEGMYILTLSNDAAGVSKKLFIQK